MLILERPWTQQPQGAVGVNKASPLSAGLRILFNGAEAPIARDVVTGRIWTPSGNVTSALGNSGRTLKFDGVNDSFDITSYSELTGSVGTFFAWFPVVSAGDPDNAATGHILFSSSTVYFQIGNGVNNGKVAIHGSAFNTGGSAISWFNTINRSIVLSSGGSSGSLKCFVDGIDSGQTWGSAPASWAAGARAMQLGGYVSSTTHDVNGQILVAGYASVPWTESMARRFHNNPFNLFASRRIYIPTAAAAASAPTITALSAIGITATSAQPRITYA